MDDIILLSVDFFMLVFAIYYFFGCCIGVFVCYHMNYPSEQTTHIYNELSSIFESIC